MMTQNSFDHVKETAHFLIIPILKMWHKLTIILCNYYEIRLGTNHDQLEITQQLITLIYPWYSLLGLYWK